MRTRSSNRRRSRSNQQQQLTPVIVEEPEVPMADNRTMAELLHQAPTAGTKMLSSSSIQDKEIFELKPSIITLVQSKIFRGSEQDEPHSHIRYFESITNNLRYPNVPSTTIKLLLFPFSIEGAARTWLDKEPPRSILTWNDLDSLNSAAGGNFLDKMPNDCLRIIESKAKVRHSRNAVVSRVSTNAPPSSSSPSDFELQQIAATLEDKLALSIDNRMSNFISIATPPN
ncbi:hypothetical protein Tco_1109797 [Tanacetum coccineum]|uniref:Retrotransposon gag domain-containing protein n=1 Tax=Tanacetum coccineum TaxID=301880 RepID=A0ABQ5IJF6_9ASTR